MTGGAHHQRGTPRRACRGRGSPPLPFRCPACRRRSGPTTLTCRGGETFSVAGRGSPPLPVPRPACCRRRRGTTYRSWGQTSSVAGRGSSPLPFQRPAIHRRSWATACAQPRVHVRSKKIRKRDERGTLRSSRVGETGCATRRPPTASEDTNRGAAHFSRPIAGAKVSKAGVPVSRIACTRAEKPASGGTPRRWVRACGSGPRPPRG